MKFILVGFIIIFFSISCNRINENMLMEVEVYYVLKDSFLGNRNKCRVLLKIPKENNIVFNTGEDIILCMKNEGGVLKFTHIFNGQKKDDEYYLKTTVIGLFKNNEVSLEPHFSPININEELLDNTDYIKGKTVILSIKVKSNKNEHIEYIDAKFKDIKYEESVRVK